MKKHYLDIDGKWAFIFAYDIGWKDIKEVCDWLEALGADEEDIYRSQVALSKLNTGLTYSNSSLRMSVMCIGNATDKSQWWDTVVHEIYHLQNTISHYYDVDRDSEDPAYLQGYILRLIIKAIRHDGFK